MVQEAMLGLFLAGTPSAVDAEPPHVDTSLEEVLKKVAHMVDNVRAVKQSARERALLPLEIIHMDRVPTISSRAKLLSVPVEPETPSITTLYKDTSVLGVDPLNGYAMEYVAYRTERIFPKDEADQWFTCADGTSTPIKGVWFTLTEQDRFHGMGERYSHEFQAAVLYAKCHDSPETVIDGGWAYREWLSLADQSKNARPFFVVEFNQQESGEWVMKERDRRNGLLGIIPQRESIEDPRAHMEWMKTQVFNTVF